MAEKRILSADEDDYAALAGQHQALLAAAALPTLLVSLALVAFGILAVYVAGTSPTEAYATNQAIGFVAGFLGSPLVAWTGRKQPVRFPARHPGKRPPDGWPRSAALRPRAGIPPGLARR